MYNRYFTTLRSKATHQEFQPWIEGFDKVQYKVKIILRKELKGNPADLMQLCVDHGMFTPSFLYTAIKNFGGWYDELLDSIWDAVKYSSDLIIEAPNALGGAAHAAQKLRIPYIKAMLYPWTRTSDFPHPFGASVTSLGPGYNYVSHLIIEKVMWKLLSPHINKWRVKTLGLPKVKDNSLSLSAPFLYGYSSAIVPQPSSWPDFIHTTGYWFLDSAEHNWKAPQSLIEFLEKGPVIYIGFGSIIMDDPDAFTKVIIEAVKLSKSRVILSKGWSGRLGVESKNITLPDSIYKLDRVPHDWLFPKMAAVMHHGGAGNIGISLKQGTTAAGLRAGVPTIIHPFFGDQYFWADRISKMKLGISLRKFSVKNLAGALISIRDPKMIERARIAGIQIRNENGVQNAINSVYYELARFSILLFIHI